MSQEQRGTTPQRQTGGALYRDTRVVGVSRRIWIALGVLIFLLGFTGIGFVRTQLKLDELRVAYRELRSQARESALTLEHLRSEKEQAIADKEQLMKELAAQGHRLAEFSRGEEQAKTKLELTAGQTAKQIAGLKKRLAAAEKEVTALTAELEVARTELENARAEMERLRVALEPYSNRPAPPGQPGQ